MSILFSTLFSTLLMLLTILLISLPFIRRNTTSTVVLSIGQSSESINQKDLILGTLGEIEFDYHMDKLSKEDYQALKNNYAHMAVEVLKADIDDEIEKELEAMNRGTLI